LLQDWRAVTDEAFIDVAVTLTESLPMKALVSALLFLATVAVAALPAAARDLGGYSDMQCRNKAERNVLHRSRGRPALARKMVRTPRARARHLPLTQMHSAPVRGGPVKPELKLPLKNRRSAA